jgi:hypothetical protein
MEALNRLIYSLGENRVTMTIIANEYEQMPSVVLLDKQPGKSVLDAIVDTCDPASALEESIQKMKACTGIKVSKKHKEVIEQCWEANRLIHVNDILLDHFAALFQRNIVVVTISDSGKLEAVHKGVVCNKNESPSCCIIAAPNLIATTAESTSWLKVKETLIEKQLVDVQFVSKCLSATEVKQLALKMGLLEQKGMLKKELVSMICNTLQKN